MDKVIIALAPSFAAGIAVQRALDVIDPLLTRIFPGQVRASALSLLSLVAGILFALFGSLRVLMPLGYAGAEWVDVGVTALVISSGTEGFNSIIKFLGYAKQTKKIEANMAESK
ncbi:MAG: hypothetical protein HY070_13375 [Chloroflexi bacterium]|nr:hypothetical protein [Chloroflexota bacterium]